VDLQEHSDVQFTENSDRSIELSVVLCTYNPRQDFLGLALRSVGAQSLDYSRWEFIVVDNNSSPALDASVMSSVAGCPVHLVKQSLQGLTHARVAGLEAAQGKVIVFVDDDNELQKDYLSEVVRIAGDHPGVGVFGGITEGSLERPVGKVKGSFLPQLGIRNYGDERIEGKGDAWGEWEPIGAGMVVRREVGEAYLNFVHQRSDAGLLGRSGNNLMSGEDSLFSRLADSLDLRCSYEPSLRLRHYMSAERLGYRYLARLVYGHGRSYVILAQLLGEPLTKPAASKFKLIGANLLHRLKHESLVSAVGMVFWDAGYFDAFG